jgi:ATP dependent DNA ligase domain
MGAGCGLSRGVVVPERDRVSVSAPFGASHRAGRSAADRYRGTRRLSPYIRPMSLLRMRSRAGFEPPCQPTTALKPPTGPNWIHEIKHDGYRLMARRAGEKIALITRNGHDWADRYPSVVEAVKGLRCKSCWIDGEVVVRTALAPAAVILAAREIGRHEIAALHVGADAGDDAVAKLAVIAQCRRDVLQEPRAVVRLQRSGGSHDRVHLVVAERERRPCQWCRFCRSVAPDRVVVEGHHGHRAAPHGVLWSRRVDLRKIQDDLAPLRERRGFSL